MRTSLYLEVDLLLINILVILKLIIFFFLTSETI